MADAWARYKFKRNKRDDVLHKRTFADIAEEIGIDKTYLSQIVNGRKCTKIIAYAFCKAISSQTEIEELFEIEV